MTKDIINKAINQSENVKTLIKANEQEQLEEELLTLHEIINELSDIDSDTLESQKNEMNKLSRNLAVISESIKALKTINSNLLKSIRNDHLTYTKT